MDVPAMISELNDHGFTDESSTRKLAVLQAAIWELEAMHPWPWLETSTTLTFDGTSDVPTNWATVKPNFRASIKLRDLTNSRRIKPITVDAWEDEYAGADNPGSPRLYYFEGMDLHVWPTPAAGTTMRLRFIKWSDEIAANSPESAILIPKQLVRGLVVNGALSALYDMEDDSELAQRFDARQGKAIQGALETLFKRQYDRPDVITATDPEDWDGTSY